MLEVERETVWGRGGWRDIQIEQFKVLFVDDYVGGLDFYCLCWVRGERGEGLCCRVCEGDMFVNEGDEATTTRACSVVSECCVSRKFWCMMSLCELSFLNEGNVDFVLFEQLF